MFTSRRNMADIPSPKNRLKVPTQKTDIPKGSCMKRIAFILSCFCFLAPSASAGIVAGKAVGWSPSVSRHAVVWLEGNVDAPTAQAAAVMGQQGGRFVPSFLVVVVGQTVEMPNLDEIAHNVYSFSAPKTFNLGFYAKGERKSVTFDRPGLEELGCSIHNFMRAQILVVPNSYYSTIAADGSFRIRGVAPGAYTLKFWAEGMSPVSREVSVPAGGTTQFDFPVTPQASGVSK
jgi:plastocyanin